ncbi:MAG: alkaline phosphatase, partial [Thermoleophilia bacterium]|nr:alkaline phosphatase [Thermoleophilia bacterium]
PIVFAIIGDFGLDGPRETAVAALVKSWSPEFIMTTGDNNYGTATSGLASFDLNVGKHYGDFIAPYSGTHWDASAPAAKNRFWPTMGNKDWDIGPGFPYGDFFTLPGNERYYDVTVGPVHFTIVGSDAREPDGNVATGVQAAWAEATIKASPSPFQFVFYHHPAYASGTVETKMRWAFKSWGADAYFTGHIHNYERLVVDGQQYFVNGQGGNSTSNFGTVAAGSAVRYNAQDGAQRVVVSSTKATFQYYNALGALIDEVAIDPSGATIP